MSTARPHSIPARWAPAVADRMRAVFELLRNRRPLDERDLEQVARDFVFPNVIHWTYKQRARLPAASYEGQCPMLGGQRDCRHAPLQTAGDVAEEDRADLCRRRALIQPWSMLVTLAFNTSASWRRASGNLTHPSRECALQMWRQVLEDNKVQARWNRAGIDRLGNPRLVEAINLILDRLESLADRRATQNIDEPRLAHEQQIPERLVRYCLVYYQALELWIAKQRSGVGVELQQRVNRAMEQILPPLLLAREAGWNYYPGDHRPVIAEFLAAVDQLHLHPNNLPRHLLSQAEVAANEIVHLLRYIATRVLPALNQGLPPGDPLDDPVVQDLFWYRVGSQANSAGQPFNLHLWSQRRWSLGDPGTNSAVWELP